MLLIVLRADFSGAIAECDPTSSLIPIVMTLARALPAQPQTQATFSQQSSFEQPKIQERAVRGRDFGPFVLGHASRVILQSTSSRICAALAASTCPGPLWPRGTWYPHCVCEANVCTVDGAAHQASVRSS
jgi:hypothetical protein